MPKLRQQDVWLGYPSLTQLMRVRWPAAVSRELAQLASLLEPHYIRIERQRQDMVRRCGVRVGQRFELAPDSEQAADYALALGELLVEPLELEFQRVQLPAVLVEECHECGHLYQTIFRIEPQLLLPLIEHFIGIEESVLTY